MIGEVAALDLAWFESRPLFGAVGRGHAGPRAGERAARPARGARRRGARAAVDRVRGRSTSPSPTSTATSGWCSRRPTAWSAFFDRRAHAERARRARAGGPAGRGHRPRHRPRPRHPRHRRRPRARALRRRVAARGVPRARPAAGARVLLARAEQARDVLPEGLGARGFAVDVLPVYRTVRADARRRRRSSGCGAARSTRSRSRRRRRSPTCSTSLGGVARPAAARACSIGPVTSATAVERGLRVDAEADEHTIDGLVAALLERFWRSVKPRGPGHRAGTVPR